MVFYLKGAKMKLKFNAYVTKELDIFLKLPRMVQEMIWNDLETGVVESRAITTVYDFDNYSKCDSPIEIIFNHVFDRYVLFISSNDIIYHVFPQETIETDNHNYRVDFLIVSECLNNGTDHEVIVECDGHEFHEKTKAQVKRRNDRDYDLKMAGYDVLHFSGSEIYNNPVECVAKVINYLQREVK
jgi:very-short-patch-repair endonuclease